MRVSYGPPGHKGVTTLMAVGATDLEQGPTDDAVSKGLVLSIGVAIVGALFGVRTIRNMGAGAAIAMYGVQVVSGSRGKQVAVTTPAPAPVPPAATSTGYWY